MDLKIFRINARAFLVSDVLHLPSGVVESGQGAPQRRPVAVKNEQGFSYFERVRVKKLVHNVKLRLATLNIGTLIGKGMELVDTLIRRRVNIACLQETKWAGSKVKELENTGHKIYYTSLDRRRNGVGRVVDKDLKSDIVKGIELY